MKLIEKIKDLIFKNKDDNKSADYFNNKFEQKLLHNEPIYRVDILRAVKYNYNGLRQYGICTSISKICHIYLKKNPSLRRMDCEEANELFPKLLRSNAYDFNLDGDNAYWWRINDWKGGRMQFLDWLIKEYIDDKENLRNIKI